jgi:imidazoleglycerol phosphate dehydratase HisB
MEPIDETLLPLTSLISDLLGTNKHHIFDGNFSKISVVMTDAVERYRLRNLGY